MATRSTIAVEHTDGTVSQVYCHWDGYPEHNGRLLIEHYNSQELAETLVALGDISSLGSTIGVKHPFDNPHPYMSAERVAHDTQYEDMTTFYGRDRGEEDVSARKFANIADYTRNFHEEEFNYLFSNGAWAVKFNGKFVPLADALADLAN